MLTLKEHQEIGLMTEELDAQFTDDLIENAEYYEIDEDPITLRTKLTIYDANGGVLGCAEVEDYDEALAWMEETFELEEYDPEDIDPAAAAVTSAFGHAAG